MGRERVIDTFERIIWQKQVLVDVSLLDPERDFLMKVIAVVLGYSDTLLVSRIWGTIEILSGFVRNVF